MQLLERMLENTKKYAQHHVLCYLAVDQQNLILTQHDDRAVKDLLEQITTRIEPYLPYTCQIAYLDSYELALFLQALLLTNVL